MGLTSGNIAMIMIKEEEEDLLKNLEHKTADWRHLNPLLQVLCSILPVLNRAEQEETAEVVDRVPNLLTLDDVLLIVPP